MDNNEKQSLENSGSKKSERRIKVVKVIDYGRSAPNVSDDREPWDIDFPEHEERWIVIDEQTGEILDDAQGYGYRSAAKAHRGYAYKSMPKQKKRRLESMKSQVRDFWQRHEALSDDLDQAALWAYKDGEDFTIGDAKAIIEQSGADCEGLTIAQLIRYR